MEESSFLNPTKVIRAAGIQEGMRIADFGVGSGFFTRAAAREVGDAGVVWAVDIQRDLLPRIKNLAIGEGLHNVEVIHGDIAEVEGTHLPAEEFDFVILSNVLFSLEDKTKVFTEMARVLKPQGRALVIDWTDSHGGLGPHPDHVITQANVHTLLQKHAFVVEREIVCGAYHWGVVIRKKQ